jgi:PAS domain-containing protein
MDLHGLLLDSMPDIVFAKDLNGRYIAGNAAWALLLGQPASVLIGQLDFDLFPQDLANDFRRNDLAMLNRPCSRPSNHHCAMPPAT